MKALSELFDRTAIMAPIQSNKLPSGSIPLLGHHLSIIPLAEPFGLGWRRKLYMLYWTIQHFSKLWQAVHDYDAIHTPVGGDIGTIGILIAIFQRKKLFIRHCGTWGEPISWVDRLLQRFLERIAGGRNVVLATGGAESPPSRKNRNIHWIFATSITQAELGQIPAAYPWLPGQPLKLITVGRLSVSKNVQAIIKAMPNILEKFPASTLDVLGDGEYRSELERAALELNLTKTVTFYGNMSHDEVIRKLSEAHLFVFPTRREGFPKVVLEAMACGLPVIASRTSVIPQLLKNECGLLLDDVDPYSVSKAVIDLAEDANNLSSMGSRARMVAREYTLEKWRERIGKYLALAWGALKEEVHERS
ncbi:MAG: glycosyltransferase family 4 protein [Anaerolineales bacterium]|nr:glycosyltransferase family 4 protein [Anaerolineales bacterium]